MIKLQFVCLVFLATLIGDQSLEIIWLRAKKFSYAAGEKASIQVLTGRDFDGTPIQLTKSKLTKAEHRTTQGVSNLIPQLIDGTGIQLEEVIAQEGTHVISLRSNPSIITAEADAFKTYLKEYSLDEVIDARDKTNTSDNGATISSSWYSALILQAGNKREDTYQKSGNFPLEIIPVGHPYDLKVGSVMKFKILWNNKPLFGCRVKVWVRTNNTTVVQPIYTGKDGVIEAPVSSKGIWTVTVVKLIPSRNADAQWQGYQSSLTFGL